MTAVIESRPVEAGRQAAGVAARVDLESLLQAQALLRGQVRALQARLEDVQGRLEIAESRATEADSLRQQLEALKARYDEERPARKAATVRVDQATLTRLTEQYEELEAEHSSAVAERDQLARRGDVLEDRLAELEDAHTAEIADAQAEVKEWTAIAEETDAELAREREARREAEELAESSMSEAAELRQLVELRDWELAEVRRQREEDRAEKGSPPPDADVPSMVNAPQSVETGLSPKLLDEFTRSLRRAYEPAPALIKQLRDLRQMVENMQALQQQLEGRLAAGQVALEGSIAGVADQMAALTASRSLTTRSTMVAPAIGTAPEIGSRPGDAAESAAEAETDQRHSAKSSALGPLRGVVVNGPGEAPLGARTTAEDRPSLEDGNDADESKARQLENDRGDLSDSVTPWEERYDRIERAWLAGERVGDAHEGLHFLSITKSLRSQLRNRSDLRSDDVLLAELDRVRQQVGPNFSYCLLEGALREMHRPVLNPLLIGTRMHRLRSRHGRWHL